MPGLGVDPTIRRGGLAIRGDGQMKSGTNYLTVVGGAGAEQGWDETLEIENRSLAHDAEMTQGDEFLFDVGGDQDYPVAGNIRSSGDLAIGVKSNFFVEADEATITTTNTDINLVSQENVLASSVDDIELNAGTDCRIAALDDLHFLSGDSGGGVPFQRLQVDQAGAWRLGAGLDPGTAGFVFLSAGVGSEPTWGQVPNSGLADMPANTYRMRPGTSGTPLNQLVPLNSIPGRNSGTLGVLSAGSNDVLRADGGGTLGFGQIDTDHITGDLDQNARVGVRINNGGSTFTRRRIMFFEGAGMDISHADDAGSEEVDVSIGLSTRGANTLMGNNTGSPAVPQDINVQTESLVGRSSGNITTFLSSLNSAPIRAGGSLFFASAAEGQVLRRPTGGSLGFGQITEEHISGEIPQSKIGALTGDVTKSGGSSVTSIAPGVIVNSDVSGSAAIATSKLGALTGEVSKNTGVTATVINRGTSFSGGNAWTNTHQFPNVQIDTSLNCPGTATFGDEFRLQGIRQLNISSDITNWDPWASGTATESVIMANVTGTRTVQGIVPMTLGNVVFLINVGTGTLLIPSTGGSTASAPNQVAWANSLGVGLTPNAGCILWYETVNSKWRPVACCGTFNITG